MLTVPNKTQAHPLHLPFPALPIPSSIPVPPTMTLPTLPVLALPHPLVLLPTARITLPVHRLTGEALLNLVQESEAQPVIAAVPLASPEAPIHGWGVAARITRLIKPPSKNPKQPFLLSLHGITRIRIFEAANSESQDQVVSISPDGGLQERKVEYAPPDGVPSMEWVVKFKTAALRLLDHLARDTTQQTKRDTYNKVASMLEEMSDQRAPWMADVMVASVNGDYADKLGEFSFRSLHTLSFLCFPSFSRRRAGVKVRLDWMVLG